MLEITFKKGNTMNSLSCKRPDGTSTWMTADAFMIIHDLTHYAVETVLQMPQGFYGILEGGVDITDFEKKLVTEIPKEGIRAELIVGLLLTELNDGKPMDDFNAQYAELQEKYDLSMEALPESAIYQMRQNLTELLKRWSLLTHGDQLVLNFPPPK